MNGNDRSIVGLVTVAHALVHTYELSIPVFVSIWLVEFDAVRLAGVEVGVTGATLGLVVTAGYGLFGAGALPAGVLVDRVGSRPLIAACLFGMGGSFVLLGAAPGLLAVAVALLVWGAAASVYHPAGLTLVSTGVTERGTGFAYHGVAGNLGIGLGPLVATLLLLSFDWSTVATLLAVPALVAGVYALVSTFDETAAVEAATDGGTADPKAAGGVDSAREFLTESRRLLSGAFLVVVAIVVCSGLFYRGVLTFLPELLQGLPGFEPVSLATLLPGVDGVGDRTIRPERYFYAGLLFVGVVGQYVGGTVTDRLRPERGIAVVFVALAVLAVGFLPAASMGLGPLLVVGALLGATLFAAQPLYQAAVADHTPVGARGLSYGYTYLGTFGVGALGGAVAGVVLTYADPGTLFALLAAVALLAAALAGLLCYRRSPAPAPDATEV